MAGVLKEGPIRKRLREAGLFKRSPEETEKSEEPLVKPVTIDGITIRTMAQADGFRALYASIMSVYDEFNDKCVRTRSPYWCTSSQILGPFARKLMRAADELRAQGVVIGSA